MDTVPAKAEVAITVLDEATDQVAALAQRLSAIGLEDAVALPSIGVISGVVALDKLPQLRAEPGVKAVELTIEVDIGPPDADVQ